MEAYPEPAVIIMNSIVEIFACFAEKQPDALFAADSKGNEYSYKAAWNKIKCIAFKLKNFYGVAAGQSIMVECNQDVPYLLVDMACQLIHAVFIPIEGDASYDRKKDICFETGSVLYIYQKQALDLINGAEYCILLDCQDEISDFDFPAGDETAEILYTTGTTGKSKGIVISHIADIALAENIKYGADMPQGNVEIIPVPVSHSHGLRCCYANIISGGSIILVDGLMRVKEVFNLMDKYSATALDVSPSAAMLLIKLSKGKFWEYGRKLNFIELGTASLPEDLKKQLQENLPGVHLYNFYGSTESGRSCVLDFSIHKGKANCIGKPTKNSEIVFTDEDRNIINATSEMPGLLASRGPMNMTCYWKNPDLTAEILRDNFIYTNDLGYKDEEGFIYVLGRKDDVINYNGIKISPDEIEEVAAKYSGIKDCACVPQKDALAGQIPKLFISIENEASFDKKAFIDYLTSHLDGNKVPKSLEIIPEIPRTFNGKIKRKDLINL